MPSSPISSNLANRGGRKLVVDRNLSLIFWSSALWGFGMWLFLPIQPLYIASLGASPEQIGLVLGVSGLVVTLLYIPVGLWADRYGRKPVILAGWILGTASTLGMALAPDWRWLIPPLIAYLLSNFAMPAHRAYVAAGRRGANLSWTFAVLSSGAALGSVISPAIGGWIGEQLGLRAVYLAGAFMFFLSTLVLWRLDGQPVSPAPQGARPRQLLANRRFVGQIAFTFVLFFAIEIGQVLVPKYLQDARGLSLGQIGLLGTAGALGMVVWGLALGRLPSDRRGSLLLSQVAALAAALLFLRGRLPAFLYLAYFIHGSNYVVRPILQGRLAYSLEETTLGFGYALYETAMRAGLALAPAMAGLLYARDPTWPLIAGAGALSLTLALTLTLPGRTRSSPQPAAFTR